MKRAIQKLFRPKTPPRREHPAPSVWWPVTIHKAGDDGGPEQIEGSCEVCFVPLIDPAEVKDLIGFSGGDGFEIFNRHIIDWREVQDEDNRPLEFSSIQLRHVLQFEHVREALASGLLTCSMAVLGGLRDIEASKLNLMGLHAVEQETVRIAREKRPND